MVLRRAPPGRVTVVGRLVPALLYLGAMALLLLVAERAAAQLAQFALRVVPQALPAHSSAPSQERVRAAKRVAQDASASKLVTLVQSWQQPAQDGNWRSRPPPSVAYRGSPWQSGGTRGHYRDDGDDDDDDGPYDRPHEGGSYGWGGTYRTVCVRLCDGYYWPISFTTTHQGFERDSHKCETSCGSPARLYIHRNPGGAPEEMVDLYGQPYNRLKTAFLYRSQYDANCKCRPDPWEQTSKDEHRVYALEAAQRKGDKLVAKELVELRRKLEADHRQFARSMRQNFERAGVGAERDRARTPPEGEERMSLGGSSPARARAATSPSRIWRDTGDSSP